MIVDALAARSPWVAETASRAQIIQVPFRVYPNGVRDGHAGMYWNEADRIPRGIEPLRPDGTIISSAWTRAPYPHLILIGPPEDSGMLLLSARTPAPGEFLDVAGQPIPLGVVREVYEVILLGWRPQKDADERPFWDVISLACAVTTSLDPLYPYDVIWRHYLERADEYNIDIPRPRAPGRLGDVPDWIGLAKEAWEGLGGLLMHERTIWTNLTGLEFSEEWATRRVHDMIGNPAAFRRAVVNRAFAMNGIMGTIASAFTLLSCKNVVGEPVEPSQDRASKRRGDPPPYRYRRLRVRVFRRQKNSASTNDDTVAIHWVRGHIKQYSQARPLLGKYSGLFWWQPHLAGRNHRGFADKEYALAF